MFTYHKGRFDCSGIEVLHTYLVGLLVVLALIILSQCAIVYVSAQGTPALLIRLCKTQTEDNGTVFRLPTVCDHRLCCNINVCMYVCMA